MRVNKYRNKNLYLVRASNNVQDLIGQGLEFLTDKEGNVIAVFENGNMGLQVPRVEAEQANIATKIAA